MTTKTYVIAGTHQQADHWITEKIERTIATSPNLTYLARSNFVYVDDVIRIRGIKNPHGVFIGTWKERKDILEIVQHLIWASDSNKSLMDIHNSLKPVRPTPKVTYNQAVTMAAEELAKHIDAEVLKQLGVTL